MPFREDRQGREDERFRTRCRARPREVALHTPSPSEPYHTAEHGPISPRSALGSEHPPVFVSTIPVGDIAVSRTFHRLLHRCWWLYQARELEQATRAQQAKRATWRGFRGIESSATDSAKWGIHFTQVGTSCWGMLDWAVARSQALRPPPQASFTTATAPSCGMRPGRAFSQGFQDASGTD
jgi:hypothetical protein